MLLSVSRPLFPLPKLPISLGTRRHFLSSPPSDMKKRAFTEPPRTVPAPTVPHPMQPFHWDPGKRPPFYPGPYVPPYLSPKYSKVIDDPAPSAKETSWASRKVEGQRVESGGAWTSSLGSDELPRKVRLWKESMTDYDLTHHLSKLFHAYCRSGRGLTNKGKAISPIYLTLFGGPIDGTRDGFSVPSHDEEEMKAFFRHCLNKNFADEEDAAQVWRKDKKRDELVAEFEAESSAWEKSILWLDRVHYNSHTGRSGAPFAELFSGHEPKPEDPSS